jgi:rhomboid protease GluP
VLKRQRTGSVLCSSCGVLVSVDAPACLNCGRRNPGLWGWAPALRALGSDLGFMPFIIGACGAIYVLSLALSGGSFGGMLSPGFLVLDYLGNSGAVPVWRYQRWSTLLSAGWLHGNILHIVFNMMWVRQLVPATADLYGPGRTIIIYTVASISGFLLSSTIGWFFPRMPFFGAAYTVGASASIFGLLGAVVYYGRRSGSSMASSQAWSYALTAGAMGFILPGVDNAAHIGGFAGGYLAGRLLDPLRPERIDHVVIGITCMVVSVLTILVPIVRAIVTILL